MLKGSKFTDRASASAAAKQAMLAKFNARPSADDPAVQQRAAERRAIAEARAAREAEKQARKEEEARRVAAEQEAARQAELARQREEELERLTQSKLLEELKARQKAARDARYAARKARK